MGEEKVSEEGVSDSVSSGDDNLSILRDLRIKAGIPLRENTEDEDRALFDLGLTPDKIVADEITALASAVPDKPEIELPTSGQVINRTVDNLISIPSAIGGIAQGVGDVAVSAVERATNPLKAGPEDIVRIKKMTDYLAEEEGARDIGRTVSGLGLAGAGAVAGASVGSVVPVVGTIGGGILGAALGGLAGRAAADLGEFASTGDRDRYIENINKNLLETPSDILTDLSTFGMMKVAGMGGRTVAKFISNYGSNQIKKAVTLQDEVSQLADAAGGMSEQTKIKLTELKNHLYSEPFKKAVNEIDLVSPEGQLNFKSAMKSKMTSLNNTIGKQLDVVHKALPDMSFSDVEKSLRKTVFLERGAQEQASMFKTASGYNNALFGFLPPKVRGAIANRLKQVYAQQKEIADLEIDIATNRSKALTLSEAIKNQPNSSSLQERINKYNALGKQIKEAEKSMVSMQDDINLGVDFQSLGVPDRYLQEGELMIPSGNIRKYHKKLQDAWEGTKDTTPMNELRELEQSFRRRVISHAKSKGANDLAEELSNLNEQYILSLEMKNLFKDKPLTGELSQSTSGTAGRGIALLSPRGIEVQGQGLTRQATDPTWGFLQNYRNIINSPKLSNVNNQYFSRTLASLQNWFELSQSNKSNKISFDRLKSKSIRDSLDMGSILLNDIDQALEGINNLVVAGELTPQEAAELQGYYEEGRAVANVQMNYLKQRSVTPVDQQDALEYSALKEIQAINDNLVATGTDGHTEGLLLSGDKILAPAEQKVYLQRIDADTELSNAEKYKLKNQFNKTKTIPVVAEPEESKPTKIELSPDQLFTAVDISKSARQIAIDNQDIYSANKNLVQ